jgi:excinuclease ABC subunit A
MDMKTNDYSSLELKSLVIQGAREHNLKNIDLEIPKKKLVVFTGVSGSGKSSLAFDTIYAEGQRRYVESLSSYARQFLGQMEKPHYDYIRGLSPTIAIEQKAASKNPRSTVGTLTEIYDYLRVLFARVGVQYCYRCGRPIGAQSPEQIVEEVLRLAQGTKILLLAPVVRQRKGEFRDLLAEVQHSGFVRVRLDGAVVELSEIPSLDKKKKHTIEVVVDRLIISDQIKERLTDSVETALRVGKGHLVVSCLQGQTGPISLSRHERGGEGDSYTQQVPHTQQAQEPQTHQPQQTQQAQHTQVPYTPQTHQPQSAYTDILFSEHLACEHCGISYPELSPQIFSFNGPLGMCQECNGLGTRAEIDAGLIVADATKSINAGALEAIGFSMKNQKGWSYQIFSAIARQLGIDLDTPFGQLSEEHQQAVLYGSGDREFVVNYTGQKFDLDYTTKNEGIIPTLLRRMRQTTSESQKTRYEQYMSDVPCSACQGTRLRPEARSVRVGGKTLPELTSMSIEQLDTFFKTLQVEGKSRALIAAELVKELQSRVRFLLNVGLNYLSLHRSGPSLSGGESQRLRLASQMGTELTGVLYVLDEPSIGLHQRDNQKLLNALLHLRDIGNSLIVVEHDRETMEAADHIVDFGPGAGMHGGEVIFSGSPEMMKQDPHSMTGQYLSGKKEIPVPKVRRSPKGWITIQGASENNLKSIDVPVPLGVLCFVTGVSGAGKSSLIRQILYPAAANHLQAARLPVGRHRSIKGLEQLDKIINIDQRPIGRTPRSNPATYVKVFDLIREVFSWQTEAKIAGYDKGRFSFNVKGGRCEACSGDGMVKVEMHFLPDVYVPCEICHGTRFNEATLRITYKGKNIAQVLDATVEEAMSLFSNHPKITRILQTLTDVGLEYIKLGQSSTTLSGGEAQRIKLSRELARLNTGRTLYLLDEPTTGLHFEDIRKLLMVLNRLVDAGNSVLVIEHNLDTIKTADYIIDLGPEGGDQGGRLVAAGTPEEVCRVLESPTGQVLGAVVKS